MLQHFSRYAQFSNIQYIFFLKAPKFIGTFSFAVISYIDVSGGTTRGDSSFLTDNAG